jgi:hypothetical protein
MPVITRNRKRWTDIDNRKLIEMYKQNQDYAYMATKLQRTEDAIKARFVKLYIVKYIYQENRPHQEQEEKICKLYNLNPCDLRRYLKYAGIYVKYVEEYSDKTSECSTYSATHDMTEDNVSDMVYNLKVISKKISVLGTIFMFYAVYKVIKDSKCLLTYW